MLVNPKPDDFGGKEFWETSSPLACSRRSAPSSHHPAEVQAQELKSCEKTKQSIVSKAGNKAVGEEC